MLLYEKNNATYIRCCAKILPLLCVQSYKIDCFRSKIKILDTYICKNIYIYIHLIYTYKNLNINGEIYSDL